MWSIGGGQEGGPERGLGREHGRTRGDTGRGQRVAERGDLCARARPRRCYITSVTTANLHTHGAITALSHLPSPIR